MPFLIATKSLEAQQSSQQNQQRNPNEKNIVDSLKKIPLSWLLSGSFVFCSPQDEFRTNLQNNDITSGIGFGMNIRYHLHSLPISLGIGFDYIVFSTVSKYYGTGSNQDTLTGSNSFIPLRLLARYEQDFTQYGIRFVRPYLEAGVGFSVLNSTTELLRRPGNLKGYSQTNSTTAVFSTVGLGLQFRVADFITMPSERSSLLIDFGTRYNVGSFSNYSLVKFDEAQQNFVEQKLSSRTSAFLVNLGVTFEF